MQTKVHVATFAIFLIGSVAAAQRKDAGSPGEEHKKLAALAGDWDVSVTFVIGAGKEAKGTAKCEAKMVLDGRFLHQKYDSVFMGKPFVVEQYLGFDRQKGKFVELYMNSMTTGIMHNEGEISKDGKTIAFTGKKVDDATGKEGKIRTVYTLSDPDNFILEWFLTGPDGKEAKGVTLTHKRKK
jgi:hypothetical protein